MPQIPAMQLYSWVNAEASKINNINARQYVDIIRSGLYKFGLENAGIGIFWMPIP